MQLSDRFLNLVQQQLITFEAEADSVHLVVYVANSKDGCPPTLEAIGEWPNMGNALPPVETDQELRTPSPYRRWYPLQDGSILLGVLRAELLKSEQAWPQLLDQRLQATASALGQCLGLELDQNRLLDELKDQREQISLMVHQLRNPLTALRTYAQLLLRRLGPESKDLTLVEGLLTEQDQLNRYISALDQLSKPKLAIDKGNSIPLLLPPVLPRSVTINLQSLLEPLIERASATAKLQGRQWIGPLQWPAWTVQPISDEDGAIAEIVANLLENAFRYSSTDCSIGLHIRGESICVWDGGAAIVESERERIFQKGFRGGNSIELPGTGLGLTFGRQLAEQLGGTLGLVTPPRRFDSALPDQGNAFVLSLPTKASQEENK